MASGGSVGLAVRKVPAEQTEPEAPRAPAARARRRMEEGLLEVTQEPFVMRMRKTNFQVRVEPVAQAPPGLPD